MRKNLIRCEHCDVVVRAEKLPAHRAKCPRLVSRPAAALPAPSPTPPRAVAIPNPIVTTGSGRCAHCGNLAIIGTNICYACQ